MKRKVEIEISLPPGGKIAQKSEGHFSGGISFPHLRSKDLAFVVYPTTEVDGVHNPSDDAEPVDGAFQVSVTGTSAGYRELAKFFLALAELDTSADPQFHEHLDGIVSEDGRSRFDFIIRKSS